MLDRALQIILANIFQNNASLEVWNKKKKN